MGLIPGMFYTVITLYHSRSIGLGLGDRIGMDPNSYVISYVIAATHALYAWFAIRRKNPQRRIVAQTRIAPFKDKRLFDRRSFFIGNPVMQNLHNRIQLLNRKKRNQYLIKYVDYHYYEY